MLDNHDTNQILIVLKSLLYKRFAFCSNKAELFLFCIFNLEVAMYILSF